MGQASNYKPATVALSTTPATVVEFDANRSALLLHNKGATVARVYPDGAATEYIEIAASTTFEFKETPANKLLGVTASGTTNLVVWEA